MSGLARPPKVCSIGSHTIYHVVVYIIAIFRNPFNCLPHFVHINQLCWGDQGRAVCDTHSCRRHWHGYHRDCGMLFKQVVFLQFLMVQLHRLLCLAFVRLLPSSRQVVPLLFSCFFRERLFHLLLQGTRKQCKSVLRLPRFAAFVCVWDFRHLVNVWGWFRFRCLSLWRECLRDHRTRGNRQSL